MTTTARKKRKLICACCGEYVPGRWYQFWNQDTGYGICRKCVDWLLGKGETQAEIEGSYGKEGINFAGKEGTLWVLH
jgi:hypothetical protein